MNAAPRAGREGFGPGLTDGVIIAVVGAAWAVALAADISGQRSWVHHHEVAGSPTAAGFVVFLAAWTGMVIAMMLPTALPLLRLFGRAAIGQEHPTRLRFVAMIGYLTVWLAFGAGGLALDIGVHRTVDAWAWLRDRPSLIPGASLVVAGLFQFSELKAKCLTECRHPAAYLLRHYGRGYRAALRIGLGHGVFCVGCCWALMLLMFGVGIANIGWMAALTVMMVVEKNVPGGDRSVRVLGVALFTLGLLVLAQPDWLPANLRYPADPATQLGLHQH